MPANTKTHNAPICLDNAPANKKTQHDDGNNDNHDNAPLYLNSAHANADDGNNDNNDNAPVCINKAPANKTKHTSKGKKGNAPVSVQAAQRDNNNQDTTATAAAIQPTLALIDPTTSFNAINVPVSTITTITTNVPTTVETHDGAAGDTHPVSPNAGSKDWVTPDQGTLRFLDNISRSINLKASDTVMHSPCPLSRLELEGASCTHGGIL